MYRNSVLVEYCLDHLVRRAPPGAEIVVVDDASGAETIDVIRRFPRVRLITHDANRGNTAAYNTGVAAATGDTLVFVDSDVLIGEGVLEELDHVLVTTPSAGAVGALLVYPQTNTIQHAGVAFDRWVVTHVYTGRRRDEVVFAPLEERQAVTAALLACRRETYGRVGGFDETYRDGLEDIEFCLRCRDAGLTNYLLSRTASFHLESATRGPYKHIRRTFNYAIFFSRWAGRFAVDLGGYIERGVGLIAWPWSTGLSVTLVNFSTTPNWPDLAAPVAERMHVTAVHNLSGFASEDQAIDLYRTLPIAFHRDPLPLIFLADHFTQITQNRHWFDQRPCADLVIDRHANVIVPPRGDT